VCGDGINEGKTACDDGNKVSGDGCDSTCNIEDGWFCFGGCLTAPDTCVDYCGDGRVVVRNSPDYCDDGNNNPGDGCFNCKVEKGWSCCGGSPTSPDVCHEICGDGLKLSGNQCDDHNTVSGDGCDEHCNIELGWKCTLNPLTGWDKCWSVCEDGIKTCVEQCDDGGLPSKGNGDGCSSTC
jgi:cysteine-rich repeat protein